MTEYPAALPSIVWFSDKHLKSYCYILVRFERATRQSSLTSSTVSVCEIESYRSGLCAHDGGWEAGALSEGAPSAQHQTSGSGRSRCVVRCAGISFERSRRQSAGIERLAGGCQSPCDGWAGIGRRRA